MAEWIGNNIPTAVAIGIAGAIIISFIIVIIKNKKQ